MEATVIGRNQVGSSGGLLALGIAERYAKCS
jgi:hypothetical protein